MRPEGVPSSIAPGAPRTADLVARVAEGLPAFLPSERWFGSKARPLLRAAPLDQAAVPGTAGIVALFEVTYADGAEETYAFPCLPAATGRSFTDAMDQPEFCAALVDRVRLGRSLAGLRGTFRFTPTRAFAAVLPAAPFDVARVDAEQTHSSVLLGGKAVLKPFRRLEPGPNPEFKITDFLTRRTAFQEAPRLAGAIAYERPGLEPITLALLQEFVPNQGDVWTAIQARLAGLLAAIRDGAIVHPPVPSDVDEAARLGRLTGRLHMALASAPAGTPHAPALIEPSDLAAWHAGMQANLGRAMRALAGSLAHLPAPVRPMARSVPADAPRFRDDLSALRVLTTERVMRIRVHGDYHLGQVLRAADSFVILDFEGEPARPLAERRAAQCALKDVAGMLRSYAYAAQAALISAGGAAPDEPDACARLAPCAEAWEVAMRRAFLDGYLAEAQARGAPFLPRRRETLDAVLRAFELDKAIYELRSELDHRPAWVRIPLEGLRRGALR